MFAVLFLDENRAPTDPLDEAAQEMSREALFTGGFAGLLIGAALLWWTSRRIHRSWPDPGDARPMPFACILLMGAGYFLGLATLGPLLGFEPPEDGGELTAEHILLMMRINVLSLLAAAITTYLGVRLAGGKFSDLGLTFHRPIQGISAGVTTYLALIPCVLGATLLQHAIAGEVEAQQTVAALYEEDLLRSNYLFLFLVMIAIPILEEFVFRGVLLPFLQRWMPTIAAIALNGALFAVVHDAGRIPVFILGCALAWLAARTGNLLAPMVVHVLHNSLMVQLLLRAEVGETP